MSIVQVNEVVTEVCAQALGKDISLVDSTSIVSLGKEILSTEKNKDLFFKALAEKISRTMAAIRAYQRGGSNIRRDYDEYGMALEKIRYQFKDFSVNDKYSYAKQRNPYDFEINVEAYSDLFAKAGAYSYETAVPAGNLKQYFANMAQMGAFIEGIYTAVNNAFEFSLEQNDNLARNVCAAGALLGTGTRRKLVSEYMALGNDIPDDESGVRAAVLRDKGFLLYAIGEIKKVSDKMEKLSTIYNVKNAQRHTSKEYQVLECLSDFISSVELVLESDVYHRELLQLPRYTTVQYWQALGESGELKDVGMVDVQVDNDGEGGQEFKFGYPLLAVIRDYDSVMTTHYDERMPSVYNPFSDVNNIAHQAMLGYAVDLSENCVVFTLE